MRKKLLIITSSLSVVVCVALAVFSLSSAGEKSFYLIAVLIILASAIPFFAYFEGRKIKTSEIVALAMMVSIAVISRLVFSFVPEVKPMAAFIIVTGAAFGSNAGFIAGATAIFASNFFMGQGMYTPFQMLGMGIVGLIGGLLLGGKLRKSRLSAAIEGFFTVACLYGFIMDTCSVFAFGAQNNFKEALGVYLAGLPLNLIHGVTTAAVLFLIWKPMMYRFERLRTKYGVFDGGDYD